MVTNKKVCGKAGSVPVGLIVGTGVALLITLLFAVVITQMILTEKIAVDWMGYGAMLAIPVAAACSALISTAMIKRKRMQMCLLSGASYFLILSIVNIFFFGGQFQGVVITLLLIMGSSLGVGMLGMRRSKPRKYRPR